MLNFLLVTTGLVITSSDDNTSTTQAIGTALLGVGLARTVNEIAGD